MNLGPLGLSFKLATISLFFLLIISLPISWWLFRSKSIFSRIIESITSLPMVLPPTVLGFYLLVLFQPESYLGKLWITLTGSQLTFSFAGLVLASVIYSLPFVIQPIKQDFETIGMAPIENAWMLGMNPLKTFVFIGIPMVWRGIITGMVLGFAHTLGEFGVVLMVGGSIPGKTKVVSIALFEHVEAMQMEEAHSLAAVLLGISFFSLLLVNFIRRKERG